MFMNDEGDPGWSNFEMGKNLAFEIGIEEAKVLQSNLMHG
jgi:hypothetical protein